MKFTTASSTLTVNGNLLALGSISSKVYFTSLKDDTVGGDTNGDGTDSSPAKGDWSGIRVPAGGAVSLYRTEMRHGGYSGGTGALVKVEGGQLTVEDCVFTDSQSCGLSSTGPGGSLTVSGSTLHSCSSVLVYVQSGSAALSGNAFSSPNYWPIQVALTSATFSGSGNSFSDRTRAGVRLTGPVTSDRTLPSSTSFGAAYVLHDSLTIDSGATLWLVPGTVVKASVTTTTVHVLGTLDAAGGPEAPTYFTSLTDDTVGGDTNGDGTDTSPAKGDWSGIRVPAGGVVNLDHVEMRYGGYYTTSSGLKSLVKTEGGRATIDNSVLRDSLGYGAWLASGAMEVGGSTFAGCSSHALYAQGDLTVVSSELKATNASGLYLDGGSLAVTGCTISSRVQFVVADASRSITLTNNHFLATPGNWLLSISVLNGGLTLEGSGNSFSGYSGIRFSSCAFGLDTILPTPSSLGATAYVANSRLTVNPNTRLTLVPGTVVKITGAYPEIEVKGVLDVGGEAGSPVILTSLKDDSAGGDTNGDLSGSSPAAGDWSGIRVTVGGVANIRYTHLHYGGATPVGALLKTEGGTASVDQSVLRDSQSKGLWADGGTLSVSRSTISACNSWPLHARSGETFICENEFVSSTRYPIALDLSSAVLDGQDNVFTGRAGIVLIGPVSAGVSLPSSNRIGASYVLTGDLTVNSGKILTFNPGTVVKVDGQSWSIFVYGRLNAYGSTESPVYFTSVKDDSVGGDSKGDGPDPLPAKGDWRGISVQTGGVADLKHVEMRYGGYYSSSYSALIKAGAGSVTVADSVIRDSSYGIWVDGGSLDVSHTRFISNSTGLYLSALATNSVIQLRHNTFTGNVGYGLRNITTRSIDAADNWWGDPSGPYPIGTGDRAHDVYSNVDVYPWLTSEPPPRVEDDDSMAGATALVLERLTATAVSRISFAGDVDWFKLQPTEDAEFSFSLTANNDSGTEPFGPLPANYDLELRDQLGYGLAFSVMQGCAREVFYRHLYAGETYYVRVAGATASDYDPDVDYKLYVAQGDGLLTLEAARYRDVSVEAYLREHESDLVGKRYTKGMAYSYGNFDNRLHYAEKMAEAAAGMSIEAWDDYITRVRPGRFKTEYESGIGEYWAGIDCSGLIQRCSDEVMESTGSTYHRYKLSDEMHLSGVRDNGSNKIKATVIMGEYTRKDEAGTCLAFSLEADAMVGDVVGWVDGSGFKHIALLYEANRFQPGESVLIHATAVWVGTVGGIEFHERRVLTTRWSRHSNDTLIIRRLRLRESG